MNLKSKAEAPNSEPGGQRGRDCRGELHPQAIKGIEAFNAGAFFRAHEYFELAWLDTSSPVKDLYQGILQVGLAYYHIQRENYPGAMKMLQRSQELLAPFPENCRGVDIHTLRSDAERVEKACRDLGAAHISSFKEEWFQPVVRT